MGAAVLTGLASCALDEPAFEPTDEEERLKPIVIAGRINQEYETRANDEGFCNGDVVGIYVVDYDGETPGTLLNEGNRADNVRFTFDEAAYKWAPAYEIYWKDKKTHIDIYGYYPWGAPEDVENYISRWKKISVKKRPMVSWEAMRQVTSYGARPLTTNLQLLSYVSDSTTRWHPSE